VSGAELDVPIVFAKAVTNDAVVAIPLEGLIDFDKERERLKIAMAKLIEEQTRLDGQLANANFVERAPAEKVEALCARRTDSASQIEILRRNLEVLKG